MPTINVRLKKKQDNSYRILIEDGLLQKLPEILKKDKWGEKYAIITDTTIGKLFGNPFMKELKKAGLESHIFIFPPGDQSKSLQIVEKIMDQMLNKKIERNDAIIAIGGGVTGDLAGFIAAIYMRGIPYVHIPTSLIGMVDSAIGGKTGVNLTSGKNLAGRVYQPKAVYIDPHLLQKLPERELFSGMSETVKCAIISDPGLFRFLEKQPQAIKEKSSKFLNKIIVQSCKIKVQIIQKDEHEKGHRQILNYGHTIGHALEKLSNYSLTHGEAIAIGMKLINSMSVQKRVMTAKGRDRINNLIDKVGILEKCDQSIVQRNKADKLWKIMQSDKKAHHGIIQFVIVPEIGKTAIYTRFTKKDLIHALEYYA